MSPAISTVPVPESALDEAICRLGVHDHLCLIYETPAEQFGALVPFIRSGLARGERCVYIADHNTAEQVLDTLDEAGIPVAAATEKGALSVVTKREAYLRDGYFDPERMLSFLAESVETARGDGFAALRVTGEMTWALGGAAGSERLMEYESKLNHFFPTAEVLAICQYNRLWFPAELIRQVIETHPLVIHGATVCRNPYYLPPEEFMGPRDPSREVSRLLANLLERERLEHLSTTTRDIGETSEEGIWLLDAQRRITYANRRIAQMLGLAREELLGRSAFEFALPEERAEAEAAWERARQGAAERYEARLRRPDGSLVCVLVSTQPILDTTGGFAGALGVMSISARARS